jgi:hypothetical protein
MMRRVMGELSVWERERSKQGRRAQTPHQSLGSAGPPKGEEIHDKGLPGRVDHLGVFLFVWLCRRDRLSNIQSSRCRCVAHVTLHSRSSVLRGSPAQYLFYTAAQCLITLQLHYRGQSGDAGARLDVTTHLRSMPCSTVRFTPLFTHHGDTFQMGGERRACVSRWRTSTRGRWVFLPVE